MQFIRSTQGKRGKWRWCVYEDGEYVFGTILSFDSKAASDKHAVTALGSSVQVGTEDGQLYAGSRDFSD